MSLTYKCCPGQLVRRITVFTDRIDETGKKIGPGMVSVRFMCGGCWKPFGTSPDAQKPDEERPWAVVFPGNAEGTD